MPPSRFVISVAAVAAAASCLFASAAAAGAPAAGPAPAAAPPRPAARAEAAAEIQAEPPPFSDGIFPCSACHAGMKNRTRRELAFHDEQQSVFDHDAEHRWCLDCHDYDDRDVLRLASGETVPFTESYRLCGQCHGDKYRDWRRGVHGKRVGRWDGEKTYFLCVNCHNPHSPRFKGVKEIVVNGKRTTAPTLDLIRPEPPPRRPEQMRDPVPPAASRPTAAR
jgi:hypothetical protein